MMFKTYTFASVVHLCNIELLLAFLFLPIAQKSISIQLQTSYSRLTALLPLRTLSVNLWHIQSNKIDNFYIKQHK